MAKTSVYELVTERIISELEKGKIPWRKPWISVYGNTEMIGAFNRVTRKSYSLLNQILLSRDGEYASFNQWKAAGGKIKKGAKSEIVVFWKIFQKEVEKDGKTVTEKIPVLRYYNVFHISDVENVEPLEKPESLVDHTYSDDRADKIITDYVSREGIDYHEQKSNRAYYAPALDRVVVPCKEQYENGNEFYSTAFHELVHSTGSEKRLNRSNQFAAFGSETYSKEELVAEIGAASILNILSMETPESFGNSAAYIQSWISALRNDNRMIVSAGSKAEKAVRYIFGSNDPEKEETEKVEPENVESVADVSATQTTQETETTPETTQESTQEVTQKTTQKTRKQGRKLIIKKIFNAGKKNPAISEGISPININGIEYAGFIDGHRILATTGEIYDYEKSENPLHMDAFFKNVWDCEKDADFYRIGLDREKIAEKKRQNKENKTKKPYIVEIALGSHGEEKKYIGMNPDYILDAIDFCGIDYCYINLKMRWDNSEREEPENGNMFFKDPIYFMNKDEEARENIGLLLPVNLYGMKGYDQEA